MENWQRAIAASITDPLELAARFSLDDADLPAVTKRYPMRITASYLDLVQYPGDPIWLQCVPDARELVDDLPVDPLDEERLSPFPGIIHRYPDRVVLLVSSVCAVYCRFCMRKRGVGCARGMQTADIEDACGYIAANPTIRDVILSGGDPLLLCDDELSTILRSLRRIPHVEMIRIGSRVPVTLPERITSRLCRMLRHFNPLFLNTHFNHPREITPAAAETCARLADAGIPLGNQTVLLKGVNDDPAIMLRLVRNLLSIRVRPYYLHQMDMVRGTGHFRTTIETGLDIMASLRGHTSGLAVPSYVIDLPGGKGKVPLLPETVRRENGRFLVQNFLGEEIHYPWGDREPARSCGELRMVHGAFGGGDDGPLGKVMP